MPTTAFSSVPRAAVRAVLLLLLAAGVFASPSYADHRLDPALAARARQLVGRSRVIVEFRTEPDTRVITQGGGTTGRRLAGRPSQVAEIDNRGLDTLARDPRVARVVLDRPAFATMERTGAAVGAVLARQELGLTGRGIGVAVIDSGITSWHDDLNLGRRQGRVVHFRDLTRASNPNVWSSDTPSDEYGHGTHVAGIIAGSGYDSNGRRRGIAPEASLIGLKVLDGEGHGYISDVIAAIDYAIAIRDTYNIRVINLSVAAGVSESYRTDPLAQAARRAVDAGIVVVASAGNLGQSAAGSPQFGGITSPGNAPWVLTVGASTHAGTAARSDDAIAPFSSRGPSWIDFAAKPDIVAPGVGIESLSDPASTLYAQYPAYLLDGTRPVGYRPYLSLSGTSMAAPVVAGAVALMLEANPALTPNAVKALLEFTAQRLDQASPLAQGAGLLNASGAVRMARFFATPSHGLGEPADQVAGEHIPWARHVTWGNDRISGGLPLPGSNAWSLDVTWGARATSAGDAVVLGVAHPGGAVWTSSDDENIVWSTSDDENIVWSTSDDDNIVWSTSDDDNIVWSTSDDDNIVWSTGTASNVVWGTDCGGLDCSSVIWGTAKPDGSAWGTSDDENIVWSTSDDDNIVWSTSDDDNIVWSTAGPEPVLWAVPTDDPRRYRPR